MERYHLTRGLDTEGYDLEVHEIDAYDPRLIPTLSELDLLTYSEATFSRYTLGAILRHGRVFTVTADALVIGACHCIRDFANPDEVVIFNMALRPGWRGHGLGTRFLLRVLERLQGSGVKSVALAVATTNQRAIAVYRVKFGFRVVEKRPDEYGTGAEYLFMRLDLTRPLPDVLGEHAS
jgi:ribosomal-protein-alanine N-acetyltransferase